MSLKKNSLHNKKIKLWFSIVNVPGLHGSYKSMMVEKNGRFLLSQKANLLSTLSSSDSMIKKSLHNSNSHRKSEIVRIMERLEKSENSPICLPSRDKKFQLGRFSSYWEFTVYLFFSPENQHDHQKHRVLLIIRKIELVLLFLL